MRSRRLALVFAFFVAGNALAQDEPRAGRTWQDMMAEGIVPYRQLTVDDFPINDKVYPEHAFHIRTTIAPEYQFILKPHSGFAYAAITQWTVFSGLDKNGTSRKSRFKTMKVELPYAQALLDLNEIHARKMGALKTGELPSARGNSFEEAQTLLAAKLKEFLAAKYKERDVETEAFAKATGNGGNKKKVRELAAGIRKRLEATPDTTVPFSEATATPGSTPLAPVSAPSVAPAASATSIPSPSPTRPKL
jgi:hypothetical protein